MQNIFNFLMKNDIGEPPWDYDFLYNLSESDYPKYLAKIFNYRTGEKLPLKYDFKNQAWIIDKKRCKTFNQKIQWIKLYGIIPLMKDCTDKVKVRDYVKERIGEEYLKPALQIIGNCSPSTSGRGRGEGIPLAENNVSTYFDQIDFDKLPNAFVIKCNHGCKWQYIIKDKEQFLNTPQLFDIVKKNITGWLEQEYCYWGGFEMQYKGIEPKIIIEPLMRENVNKPYEEIQVYCYNNSPKFIIRIFSNKEVTIYDNKFNIINGYINNSEKKVNITANSIIKQTSDLSKTLSKKFIFARVDWLIFRNNLYFEELTFTPYSGFHKFKNYMENLKNGHLLKIGENYGF